MTEELKEGAYKLTGSLMENADLMSQAIDVGDWRTASDLAATTSQVMTDMARMCMGIAASEAKEGKV